MQIALTLWKDYQNNLSRQKKIFCKIIQRIVLIKWRIVVDWEKYQERILLQIILNRWKFLAEDRTEKRQRLILALNHRAYFLCEKVMRSWMEVTKDTRGRLRLRTPNVSLGRMRNAFSSDLELRNNSEYRFNSTDMDRRPWFSSRHFKKFRAGGPSYIPNRSSKFHSTARRLDYSAFDSTRARLFDPNKSMSTSFLQSSGHRISNFKPSVTRRCLPSTSRYEQRVSPQTSTIFSRPIEDLIRGRRPNEGHSRSTRPNIPPWILNELSDREEESRADFIPVSANRIRSKRLPQDNEIAEPKQIYDRISSSPFRSPMSEKERDFKSFLGAKDSKCIHRNSERNDHGTYKYHKDFI